MGSCPSFLYKNICLLSGVFIVLSPVDGELPNDVLLMPPAEEMYEKLPKLCCSVSWMGGKLP